MAKGLPSGSSSLPPSRLHPAARNRSSALRSSARSEPEPSETGGVHGSPNTSSGTRPRKGSSKASSSAPGGPFASMSPP